MTTPPDVRVRRPLQYEVLVQQLREEAAFPTYRDALLFAAALGFQQQRRVSFTSTAGDLIRYDTLIGRDYGDALVSMLATRAHPDEPVIMDDARLAARVTVFEEYANGGLEYLQEQMNVRHQPVEQVVIALVTEALAEGVTMDEVTVDELLGGASW